MTSDRKTKANRANARVSTGPNTVNGRARSAQNAFRHGLSLPVHSDQVLSKQVQALARLIAGSNASAHVQMLARQVAEAEVDLRRVRLASHQLLSQAGSNSLYDSRANIPEKMSVIPGPLLTNSSAMPEAAQEEFAPLTLLADKLATILAQQAKAIEAMHRYERRARSRRKFAIRTFDAACRSQ